MRRIGFIEGSSDAERFCDYLISQQIHASAEPEGDQSQRYAIWVQEEQRLDEARAALQLYLADPSEGRFEASKKAKEIRLQEAVEKRKRLKNVKKLPRTSTSSGPLGASGGGDRAPLTVAVIALCVVIGLLTGFGNPSTARIDRAGREHPTLEGRVYHALTFVDRREYRQTDDAFASIRRGEVWRVITPAILHGSIGHLAMNMMGLFFLGSVIERLHGFRWYAVMILSTALIASLVQVFWPEANNGGPLAVGASGVTYGLFGFLLIRPHFDPLYPVRLPPVFQALALGFLIAGVLMIVRNIANGAHVGGLATGMVFAGLIPGGSPPWRRN
jgi:GlpG protein